MPHESSENIDRSGFNWLEWNQKYFWISEPNHETSISTLNSALTCSFIIFRSPLIIIITSILVTVLNSHWILDPCHQSTRSSKYPVIKIPDILRIKNFSLPFRILFKYWSKVEYSQAYIKLHIHLYNYFCEIRLNR